MAYDPALHEIVLFGGYDPYLPAAGDTWTFNASGWTDITSTLTTSPPARWGSSLVWDPNASALVLFGGRDVSSFYNDTWLFNATGWHQVATVTPSAPSVRGFYQMFFDPVLQKLVLFGGSCYCGYSWVAYNDTWYFSGSTWTSVTALLGKAPPADNNAFAAWDNASNEGVVFGGSAVPATCHDFNTTWTFTGGWNQTAPTNHPGPFTGGATVYDSNASQLVVYGGLADTGAGGCYNPTDTWSYVAGTWVNITPAAAGSGASPPGRCCASMAFDPDVGAVIMFGGNFEVSGTYLSETWALLPPAAVGAIYATPDHGAAPLNVSFTSLVTGSVTIVGYNWSFGDGSPNATGQNVSHVYARAGSYLVNWTATDSTGQRFNASTTVTVSGPFGTISATPTSGRAPLNVSFFSNLSAGTPVASYAWDFGDGSPNASGQNVSHLFTTWGLFTVRWTATDTLGTEYNASVDISVQSTDRWNDLSSNLSTAPTIRAQTSMAYDPARGGLLLFGGYDPSFAAVDDTWLFADGAWTNLNATGGLPLSPPARWGDTVVWDPIAAHLVLFGGRDTSHFFNDTWTFDATGWHNATSTVGPAPRGWSAMFFDPVVGKTVLFGGTALDPYSGVWLGFNDTWYLSGTTWRNVSSSFPLAPLRTSFPYSGWDPSENRAILFGGQTVGGNCADYSSTWTFATGWNLSAPTSHPPALVGGGFAYDYLHRGMLLFSGLTDASAGCGDSSALWSYANGSWTDVTGLIDPSGGAPSARCCFAMASDPVAKLVVVFAGGDQAGYYENQTWTYPAAPFIGTVAATSTVGVGPFNVTLTSAVAGGVGPYSYNWSFGDGSPNATTDRVVHEFAATGTYNVTWHATDGQGRSINRTVAIVVIHAISTSASASRLLGEAPMSVTFTAPISGGLGPFTYHWAFGDGGTSTAASPTHSYASAGAYSAAVTVSDTLGETAAAQVNVTVLARIAVVATPSLTRGIVPVDVQFAATASGGLAPYTLSWQFGDGSADGGNVTAINHSFARVGDYTTNVTVSDELGYVAIGSVTVDVASPLTTVATVLPLQGTSPLVVSYDAGTSGGFPSYTAQWTFGDGATSTLASGFHTYTAPGAYDVTLLVADSAGSTATASATVTVVAPFTATSTVSRVVGDAPSNISFTGLPTGGATPFSFAWSFGDGASGTGPTAYHVYTLAGHYHASMTATDAIGETAVDAISITIYATLGVLPPAVSNATPVAHQTNITFTATPTGGSGVDSYAWSGLPPGCAAGNVSHFACTPTTAGVYPVRVDLADTLGGLANGTVTVTVTNPGGSACPGPACPSTPSQGASFPLVAVVLGVVVVLVVVAAAVVLLRTRRRPPTGPSSGPEVETEPDVPPATAEGADEPAG